MPGLLGVREKHLYEMKGLLVSQEEKWAPKKGKTLPRWQDQNSEVSWVLPLLSLTSEAKNHRPPVVGVYASQT